MDLDEYMWRKKIKCKNMSEQTGISAVAIQQYKHRRCTPNLLKALQIQAFTKKDIPLEEMLSIKDKEFFDKWLQENKENSDKCLPGYKKRK